MNFNDIQELLKKYNINSLDELEYYLDKDGGKDECIDDPIEKNCINAQCYEDTFVPDCRKIIEIYNKYFKDDIKSKNLLLSTL